jgi:hypothetical protein
MVEKQFLTSILMKLTSLLLFIFGLYTVGYSQPKTIPASELNPYGRAMVDNQGKLELVGSAVNFAVGFEGRECAVYASVPDKGSHNYLQYELDGVYQKRIRIAGDSNAPILIRASNSGKHTLRIYKATEAHTGPIFIAKVVAAKARSLANADAPLIEFIGNSITCGAAADPSEVPCGTGVYHDQHNAYMAYGPRLARALKVNFMLSSVSGIGAYRNWNSDGPAMGQVFEKLDFQENGTRMWNFEIYRPKIVSIALGTNDLSKGDGKTPRKAFDTVTFINSYVKFVQLVKSKYPDAKIALLSSPMVKGDARKLLQTSIATIKRTIDGLYPADKPVATFFFEPMDPHGCSGHPDVNDHRLLAEQLKPFFTMLLAK